MKLVQGTLRHADISTTSDIYVHLGDAVLDEGTEIVTSEVLESSILEQFFENCIVKRFVFFGAKIISTDIDLNATSLVLQFNK